MKNTAKMTQEKALDVDRKSEEVKALLLEFFEVNAIAPVDAISGMTKFLVGMFKASEVTEEDLRQLFELMILAWKEKK